VTAAPELTGRGGWIGVERPLTMSALRGRVVVLFFWSCRDVASLRVVEELRRLDHSHAEEVVVIGVHWPSDPGETGHDAVVKAVARHRIGHPVLDDPDGATAAAFGVTARPTLVVVDPNGSVLGSRRGEGHGRSVALVVSELLAGHGAPDQPLAVMLPAPVPDPLAFPAGVAVSDDGRWLAVADTGHDRVLVTTIDGLVLAAFTGYLQPAAVRFDGGHLLVCDTVGGRLVRSDGTVLADGIAWPCGLVAAGDGSWIAAEGGGHRLVRLRPGEITTRVAAGNGTQGLLDGPDLRAELDQPAGVALDAEGVVFVDAGTGWLRRLRTGRRGGEVVSLAGGLHHPRGVAARPDGAAVYVADTGASAVVAWDGEGWRPLDVAGLDEPAGIDLLPDGRLVVADTNNHRVVLVDPATGAVEPIVIDETWAHATDGDPVRLGVGETVAVPVHLDLVDEGLAAPALVEVTSRPPGLLAGRWVPEQSPLGTPGVVEVRAGGPGRGLLLVAVTARTTGGGGHAERVQRRRHRFEVTGALTE